MSPTLARGLLVSLCTVGAVELGASALAYRQRIDDGDFEALAAATATIPEVEPILLAQPWLGPRVRMEVPALRSPKRVAPPDLRGIGKLHTIGLDDVWSPALDVYRENATRPLLLGTTKLGAFTLATWSMPAEHTLWDWADAPPDLATGTGRCSGRGPWKCPEGRVALEFAEVDYLPRYALWANLNDGATLTAGRQVELGDHLLGHIGFSDFNARLRSDGPVRVEVRINGEPRLEFVTSDAEGWRQFEVDTVPGSAHLELALTSAVRGTWDRAGYGMSPIRLVGFELRAVRTLLAATADTEQRAP